MMAPPPPPSPPPGSARFGPSDAARRVLDALEAGDAVAVATLVSSSVPGAPLAGARMLLREDGALEGSLGDAALDAAAADVARTALEGAAAATHALQASGDATARVFVEAHLPPDELVVVGAGHIAVPLARIGAMLGFSVTVLDDREEFADEARFPQAARVITAEFEPPANPFERVRLGRRSHVVLVTRAHRYDFDCLARLLELPPGREPRYIGMIGSRRRVRAAFEAALAAG